MNRKRNSPARIAETTFAGDWYSGRPEVLRREMKDWLNAAAAPAAQTAADRPICALIVPHAGYAYSGAVAAHAYRAVQGRSFSRVVLLGPAHYTRIIHRVRVESATLCRTILGDLEVDRDFTARLLKYPVFVEGPEKPSGEHSIELQYPWLQAVLGAPKIVPLICGALDSHSIHEAAGALRMECDEQTLLVVSSDFTHYGPRFDFVPFPPEEAPARLPRLDLEVFEQVKQKNIRGLMHTLDRTGATVCGRDPLSVLTVMLGEQHEVERSAYDTSGRLTGDWENSVSYLSAIVRGAWTPVPPIPAARKRIAGEPDIPEDASAAWKPDSEDQTTLLRIARKAIEWYLARRRRPTLRDMGVLHSTVGLRRHAGAFVTLHKGGDLRGCIGEILPSRAVAEAVLDQALNSAFRDPRFPPVEQEELKGLSLEISVLEPPHDIASPEEYIVGKHGIILSQRNRSAVFLPQVATEQHWDRETVLNHLAVKAGLEPDAWREPGAQLSVFEAVVFHE